MGIRLEKSNKGYLWFDFLILESLKSGIHDTTQPVQQGVSPFGQILEKFRMGIWKYTMERERSLTRINSVSFNNGFPSFPNFLFFFIFFIFGSCGHLLCADVVKSTPWWVLKIVGEKFFRGQIYGFLANTMGI